MEQEDISEEEVYSEVYEEDDYNKNFLWDQDAFNVFW